MFKNPIPPSVAETGFSTGPACAPKASTLNGFPALSLGILIGLGLILHPVCAQAELRDPTQPMPPPQANTTAGIVNEKLVLSAIWRTAKSKRATINGVSAKEGESISDSVTIIRIGKNEVTVNQNGDLKTLQLRYSSDESPPPPSEQPPAGPKAAIK